MTVLLIIDVQNDFLPSGALPVKDGDEVIPVINTILPRFDWVVATQDWHPHNHGSFAANHPGRREGDIIDLNGLFQVLWPIHCVQDTWGAELAPDLRTRPIERIFFKGTDPGIDSYSGFFDNGHRKSTGLDEFLRTLNVTDVYIAGLATDYCVKFTALDAKKLSFNTWVIEDAVKAVNLNPGDDVQARKEMAYAGIHMIRSNKISG